MPSIPKRKLGAHGPEVPRLGFGCMGLSAFYGPPKPDADRMAVLDAAYAAGETFWDSADMYADSEDLLGRWFAANPSARNNIFLATKFGNKRDEKGNVLVDSRGVYAKEACKKSLGRLGVEHIDLYYCHRLNKDTPIEETVKAMKELKDEGKIKYLGLSECSAESLRRACKVAHIDAVQVEYSPFALEIESEQIGLLKVCRELGVAVVAYSPIGRGLISGNVRSRDDFEEGDSRKWLFPRFSEENFPKNLELVDTIGAIAKKKGVTPTQLTLAWLMAQGDDVFPIPGTTNLKRLEENLKSAEIQLTKDEEKQFRDAVDKAEVHGARYPDALSSALYVTTV